MSLNTTKKNIFLTGASGNMGHEGFKELLKRRDKFNIIVLVLPTAKDKEKMLPYESEPGVQIIWGDLTNYDDVLKCVSGADYVLHVGGMVSPMADYRPKMTTQVNVGAIENILRAIKSQPDPDRIKLVYIGTVAQTGDRNPPHHWGRTGDPIKISVYDNYAVSKTIAERKVIESGLKYWVSLRQTGILYSGILDGMDPIMFHEPINGVFEWVTAKDSGRLLANACEENVPESFWRRIYNIGGGEAYRTDNYEFMQKTFGVLGIKDFRKIVDLNWFATRNFHGQWYEDSDILEEYLHFRSSSIEEFLDDLKKSAPLKLKAAKFVPAWMMKNMIMRPVAKQKFGTLYWMEHNISERITSFFGSKKAWENIPTWEEFTPSKPSLTPIRLNHGYNETKPASELDLDDMIGAAAFRGGSCTSTRMTKGDLSTRLGWSCAFDHEFEASPTLVLLGGHWCPHCMPDPWNYDEEAKRNPFFAQVWYPYHSKDEANFYDERIYDGIEFSK
ncbi:MULTISPECIES: NAD-dependent epimerase/dehydratase family protein [unclassified Paenibacillus]|uniref:NAD-dependent epimerase/dehydratase family protein n=1 Tax=unclassified Paenibacillus TaxID=185978 RepID=UPI0009A8A263|nr:MULTISPECIES: NAD(P)-dependent oxidoreductase [unclassified Paenibacillus]SLK20908.1 Nucleoside-diphosphate-sugar epimerase [Paenibacillus sp. RU5A]SOC76363.1 Nucleoside-diphosphate-sugar epimerase [Paenibacillus sp. RU26A]SOC77937.1 Nucleoside-diphosphate-sugar epimerase [Paenibacillus sp. RU5M]